MCVINAAVAVVARFEQIYKQIKDKEITKFREEATSGLLGFHVGPLSWSI